MQCRRATTTVEFALVGTTLVLVTFGIVDTAVLYWARSGLESAAAATARCGATGYTWATTTCTTTATTQAYAVAAATAVLLPNVITSGNVTVTSAATSCNTVAGKFFIVSISSSYFSFLPQPFANKTVSVTACYPMA